MKPSINAGLDELAGQMDRGATAPTMPTGMSRMRTPGSGPTGAVKGIPSRVGAPRPVTGSYQGITGSPAPSAAAVKPGTVPGQKALGGASNAAAILSHGRTLGAIAHLRAAHGDHPHFQSLHAKATSGLSSLKGVKKQGGAAPKFGALGGTSGGWDGGSSIPSVGGAAPGSQPLGMGSIEPDGV